MLLSCSVSCCPDRPLLRTIRRKAIAPAPATVPPRLTFLLLTPPPPSPRVVSIALL